MNEKVCFPSSTSQIVREVPSMATNPGCARGVPEGCQRGAKEELDGVWGWLEIHTNVRTFWHYVTHQLFWGLNGDPQAISFNSFTQDDSCAVHVALDSR
jgi:hypothetical protein